MSEVTEHENSSAVSEEIRLRIDWEDDADKSAEFANHVVASFDGATYTVRFYQVLPPVQAIVDPVGFRQAKTVKGRHVATLVINSQTLPGIVQALQNVMRQENKPEEES